MCVKVGCCGFPVEMSKYFKTFKVVEVQKTFYKPPSQKTAKKWREEAPNDFEFTIKAWQVITHPPSSPTYRKVGIHAKDCGFFKPTEEVFKAGETTEEIAKILKAKFVLFQTPKSFKDTNSNMQNMKEFFGCINRNFIFGFEPRGWREENIRKICEELDLIHVVDPFISRQLYGRIFYFRLHGFNYRHKYTDDEMRQLVGYLRDEGYVLFNNIHMYDDAIRFMQTLKQKE